MNEAPLSHVPHSYNNQIPAMDEATLRKLSRAELQKLAKEHKVKANMKSVVIIRELVKLYEAVPLIQDEDSEEPPRKKSRIRGESPSTAGPSTGIVDLPMDTIVDRPIIKEDATSPGLVLAAGEAAGSAAENIAEKLPSLSPILESHAGHPAAEDNSGDSDSNLSYASLGQQEYYKSPVSSRAGTPPPEEPQMLGRAVKIMNQITADDQRVLVQIAALRQRAATLKQEAKNVRDVVRAEKGRRERLEAYFAHWRQISPEWPKDWLYEEGEEDQLRTERVLKATKPTLPSTGPTGPPTLSFDGKDAPDSHMALRRRQLQPRQEAREQENGAAAAPPTEVEQTVVELPTPRLNFRVKKKEELSDSEHGASINKNAQSIRYKVQGSDPAHDPRIPRVWSRIQVVLPALILDAIRFPRSAWCTDDAGEFAEMNLAIDPL
ncbi:hypothetical protein DEU56DRAFT_901683 [Suillus clintonianus]|uniref:uncharacterized protein n=1 Tax=Suillus clintonianus TaxID=1904413 RepID=UPI001B87ED41|nr:uncharacterized protein DEU56DRAFT_901683 [Suillus clintonianus]KAG2135783.1 hypothetical protein DEU56DRAFT_901683 [Suillus clintonianus]